MINRTNACLACALVLLALGPPASSLADTTKTCHGDGDVLEFACQRNFTAHRRPSIWSFDRPPRQWVAYRLVADGAVFTGGENGTCVDPVRRDGLRAQIRLCVGDPFEVRYAADRPTRFRLEFEFFRPSNNPRKGP